MYLLVVWVYVGVLWISCDAASVTSVPLTQDKNTSNIKIVNVIKQSLLKNNDDYKDALRTSVRTELLNEPAEGHNAIPRDTRRNDGASLDVNRTNKIKDLLIQTITSSTSVPPPEFKKSSKMVSFLEKHKELASKFMEQKSSFIGREGVEGGGARWKATLREGKIPGPRELDMAPAAGYRAHALRMQNKLCQRSVMMPEGPKYDSKGNVIMRQWKPQRKKDYHQTRVPKFQLPRCCNCCSKSVLGCE